MLASGRLKNLLTLVCMGGVLCAGTPNAALASGLLPSLDLPPAVEAETITPITELLGNQADLSKKEPNTNQPLENKPVEKKLALPEASEEMVPAIPATSETPAVNTSPKLGQESKNIKPVSYSPAPAIAIFPVVKHGHERAFSDLPLLFAREYAQRMELKAPDTKVYHPIYSVDEIRMRGLGHVYDQIMSYYKKAGRPEPMALDYLLKQLASDGQPVSRVVFVEADLDVGHPTKATGLREFWNRLLTDTPPRQMKYFVQSRLQVFDADDPGFRMVWGGSWSRSIKTDQFMNVTPSVYDESDSQHAFAKLSRQMSRELLMVTPQEAYMLPQYDTSVQGQLVSGKEKPFPNFTEKKSSQNKLTNENKQAIQRILQRQSAINP